MSYISLYGTGTCANVQDMNLLPPGPELPDGRHQTFPSHQPNTSHNFKADQHVTQCCGNVDPHPDH